MCDADSNVKLWIGGNGNWNDDTNWSPFGIPLSGNKIIIDTNGGTDVVVQLDLAFSIDNYGSLTINNGVTLVIDSGIVLSNSGGTISNNGIISNEGQLDNDFTNIVNNFGMIDNYGTIYTDFKNQSEDWSSFTPRFAIDYKVNDEAMIYASIAKGFRPGSFHVRADNQFVDEEVLWNYEIGFKTDWFNNRMRLNGAIFYSDFTDIQIIRAIEETTPGGGTLGKRENAGEASIQGFELEWMARVKW